MKGTVEGSGDWERGDAEALIIQRQAICENCTHIMRGHCFAAAMDEVARNPIVPVKEHEQSAPRRANHLLDQPLLAAAVIIGGGGRSEEHTSELQSLMRISYAVFCLKKKTKTKHNANRTS